MRFKTTSSLSLITAVILFFATNVGVRAETYGYSGSFYFSTNGSEVTIRNCWQWQGDVIVPETLEGLPVTRVADYAFGWELSSITIPNTVTFIEDNAFSNCSPATTVNVPDSVTHVGISAFTRMSNLVESQFGGFAYLATTHEAAIKSYSGAGGNVTIPETIGGNPVVYVFSSAFQNSTNLTSIALPSGITTIGSSAFQGCTNLTSVTIPDGVTTIGNSAFQGCTNLTSLTLPDGVTTIGSSAFEDCTNLASIIIPTGVTTIQSLTFGNCTNLKSVSLPAAITSIGNRAFMRCGLDNITIPYGVTSIGEHAFMSCALTSVTIPDSVTFIDIGAFALCASLRSATLPNTLTAIPNYMFIQCSSLTVIAIPDSVHTIGDSAFEGTQISSISGANVSRIGVAAFYGCRALETASFSSGGIFFDIYAFDYCESLKSINIPVGSTIREGVFYGCRSLTSVIIPEGVPAIERSTFQDCSSLTNISIPDSVTSIGDYAFYGCTNLTGLTIPDSVNSIGYGAFSQITFRCSVANNQVTIVGYFGNMGARGEVIIPSILLGYPVTAIGSSAFAGCTGLQTMTIANSVRTIGSSAFQGCTSLLYISIPESVTSVEDSAFADCTNLMSVTISSSELYEISNRMFERCSNLTYIAIPDSISSIGDHAFENCTSLMSISGANVSKIGVSAFGWCSSLQTATFSNSSGISFGATSFIACGNLKNINIPSGSTLGWSAFGACSSLESIVIPEGIISIEEATFALCTALTQITIPESVKNIGHRAFWGCANLTQITIPESVKNIGELAFLGCANLTAYAPAIYPPSTMEAIFAGCREAWFYLNDNNGVMITGGWSDGGPSAPHLAIPDSINGLPVIKIGEGWEYRSAFQGRTQLQSVYIPSTVIALGTYTFQGCTNLTVYARSIYPPGAMDAIFGGCKEAWFYLNDNNGAITITDGWSDGGPSAPHLAIPDSIDGMPVVKIGDGSFQGRTQLQSVYIPSTISTIGAYSFQGCANLSITLSDSITTVGENAFDGCLSVVSSSNGRSPLELWRQTFFADREDAGSGANLATPMGDGVPNLVKYALCLNPTQTGVTPSAQLSQGKLNLKFQRDPSRNDISIKVEATNDLASSWTTIATSLSGQNFTGNATILETDAGEGIKNMEICDTEVVDNQNKKRFLRISISQ
jgi:hypothetical protein